MAVFWKLMLPETSAAQYTPLYSTTAVMAIPCRREYLGMRCLMYG